MDRRKIIFISNEIGIEAPGIVYAKLLSNLANTCDISIFSTKINTSILEKFKSHFTLLPSITKLPYYIDKILFSICGEDYLGKHWATKSLDVVLEHVQDADIVVSAISSFNCEPLFLGRKVANKLHAKWVVYSVDAIPAPLGWSRDDMYYRNLKRFIGRNTLHADAFFSSNPVMLDYEKTCLDKEFNGYTGVVYTPFSTIDVPAPDITKAPVFLYTGSLYGLRHVDTLMEAFSKFIKINKDAKIIFVGNIDKNMFSDYLYLEEQGNLQLVGYTDKLDQYYAESTVLVDLAADIPNDVFLSSKIINYLPLQRPIIAIGGEKSSASVIFSDPSVIISSYDSNDIYDSFIKSLQKGSLPSYDRKRYLDEMSDKTVSDNFYKNLLIVLGIH